VISAKASANILFLRGCLLLVVIFQAKINVVFYHTKLIVYQ